MKKSVENFFNIAYIYFSGICYETNGILHLNYIQCLIHIIPLFNLSILFILLNIIVLYQYYF